MADLGLNVFQVIQNELIQREGNRSTLGIGYRLAIIEEKITNVDASNKNSKVWKPWHAIAPISSQTPESRSKSEAARRTLLSRRGANHEKDDKDPTKLPRDEERWEIHSEFPRTLIQFKELQYHPDIVASLLEFYDIRAYRPDLRPVDIHPDDRCRDVRAHMECCMEELAMHFGLNWQRIGGLSMPNNLPPSPASIASPSNFSSGLPRSGHTNY